MDLLLAQLKNCRFPELADALRSTSADIIDAWDTALRQQLPHTNRVTADQPRQAAIPGILMAVAEALACPDADRIQRLMRLAPEQGLQRFRHGYDVVDLLREDRLLRSMIVTHVEAKLERQMNSRESAALHASIDLVLQQAIIALVDEQKAELSAAAERELKYLSFLSHDLNNNLSGITLMLNLLRQQLLYEPACAHITQSLDAAQCAIRNTIEGMRRLLEHERLRKGGAELRVKPVDLHELAWVVARQYEREAQAKELAMTVQVAPGTVIATDPDLVMLALQNLVGNAVKYSSHGGVEIQAREQHDGTGAAAPRHVLLSVADHGPGISPEHQQRIFAAFRRGETHGREGVGLGLAIASQAARLLGAELTVASRPGAGTTFSLALPVQ